MKSLSKYSRFMKKQEQNNPSELIVKYKKQINNNKSSVWINRMSVAVNNISCYALFSGVSVC